jgi:hypothetical protein
VGVGVADRVGVGVDVGAGVAVCAGVGVGVGVGEAPCVGVAVGVADAFAVAVALGFGVGLPPLPGLTPGASGEKPPPLHAASEAMAISASARFIAFAPN